MARIYGRTTNTDGTKTWVKIEPAAGASSDELNIIWLIQSLLLIQGESPFFPQWGVNAYQAVQNQVAPDLAVNRIQQKFSQYFPYLSIKTNVRAYQSSTLSYSITLLTNSGTTFETSVTPR